MGHKSLDNAGESVSERGRMDPISRDPEVFAGRFTLREVVGTGTQGTVYRAYDKATLDPVALKIYRGVVPGGEVDDFVLRIKTIATLADPFQITYMSGGMHMGQRFLAMEWVAEGRGTHPGKRLSDWLSGKRLSLFDGLEVCKRVARAMARLHRAGLVHGNVKPDNVLLPMEDLRRAKLSDGFVNVWNPLRYDDRWFRSSVGFASPEMLRTGELGPRDDVYSLGALLFRCITGCMPFPEHDVPDPAKAKPASKTPRRAADYIPSLWPEVDQLLGSLLAHDPADRPADAVGPCLTLYRLAARLRSHETLQEAELDARVPVPRYFDLAPPPPPDRALGFDPREWIGERVIEEHPPIAGNRPPEPVADEEVALREGDVFGERFVIEELAGRGSRGAVYKARDTEAKETVALRIYDVPATEEEQARFFVEVKEVARHYHPRVVRVARTGTWGGRLFLAMDWVSGETLQARLDRKPLTLREAFTVIRGIAEGLTSVHGGAVHRNLLPRNVLLRNRNVEWVKLSDCALPRLEAWSVPPVPDAVFLAPELVQTGHATFRGDVYAFGVIAFQLVTGCLPFEANDLEELAALRSKPAPGLAELRPDAPEALCRFVDSLLQRDPEKRRRGVSQVAEELPESLDLGWGADEPPMKITRAADGRRAPVLPPRVPLDPFSHVRFQDFLARELEERCPEGGGRARLSAIAHAAAAPKAGEHACALCASPVGERRKLVELRDGGVHPLEDFELSKARQPAVCVPCLQTPFVAIHAAVKATLAAYEGDAGRPLGVVGPTRGEVRSGLRALYDAAIPRVASGRCGACGATGDVVQGAHFAVCPKCLSGAKVTYDAWLAEAPARKVARDRARFNEIYRLAEERAGRKMVAGGPSREGVDDLKNAGYIRYGGSCKFAMDQLRTPRPPTQAEIDAVADTFSDTMLWDIFRTIEGDPELGDPGATAETGYLADFVKEFRATFRPSPAKDERLRVAIAVMAEGLRRGARFYQKDDDNCYTHNVTGYFEDFLTMPVR